MRQDAPGEQSSGPTLSELIRTNRPQQLESPLDDPPVVQEIEPAQPDAGEYLTPLPTPREDATQATPESPSDRLVPPIPDPAQPNGSDVTPGDQADSFDALNEAGEANRRQNPLPGAQQERDAAMLDDDLQTPRGGLSCDEFREKIRERTIRDISLDISPPFRPYIVDQERYEQEKAEFLDLQPIRDWRTADGRELATGRLVDLAFEKAIIETGYGTIERLPVGRLSEADLAYISANWGLPAECINPQVEYTPRNWQPLAMTWAASNLCHKPLYFNETNLERYGHTAGPVLQPVISSAHFFANIAVLPYKMGVHPPGECQYALGYYRPGNCAPWILPPVPLSLRGGLSQAAAMTGAFWLIP